MASYADAARPPGGPTSRPSRGPAEDPPLHHIPLLEANAVFIDIRAAKADVTREERNAFLIDDLQIKADDVLDVFNVPSSNLLRVSFSSAASCQTALDRLLAGVPWTAHRNTLVYGWSPADSITQVRITGVPVQLDVDLIVQHMRQFGHITRARRGQDRFFPRATDGIVHLSIHLEAGTTLPHFLNLQDSAGKTAVRLFVYTDSHRRRCSRCGHTGHVGQYCRAGVRAPGATSQLWSSFKLPDHLQPRDSPPPSSSSSRFEEDAVVDTFIDSRGPPSKRTLSGTLQNRTQASPAENLSSEPSRPFSLTPALPGASLATSVGPPAPLLPDPAAPPTGTDASLPLGQGPLALGDLTGPSSSSSSLSLSTSFGPSSAEGAFSLALEGGLQEAAASPAASQVSTSQDILADLQSSAFNLSLDWTTVQPIAKKTPAPPTAASRSRSPLHNDETEDNRPLSARRHSASPPSKKGKKKATKSKPEAANPSNPSNGGRS